MTLIIKILCPLSTAMLISALLAITASSRLPRLRAERTDDPYGAN
jgi:hypothetical protein